MPLALEQRLLRRVVRDSATDCWNWTGSLRQGYGQIWTSAVGGVPRRLLATHRAMYELKVGPIPEGLDLDHLCRNLVCCNPDHLEPVTRKVNVLRGHGVAAVNARKVVCPRGHAFGDRYPNGRRRCLTCDPVAPTASGPCVGCLGPVVQSTCGRRRRFCTDACRIRFHNTRRRVAA